MQDTISRGDGTDADGGMLHLRMRGVRIANERTGTIVIELEVKDYCKNCLEFEPSKETGAIRDGRGKILQVSTVIFCEHKDRCESIYNCIKGGQNDN